MSVDEDKKKLTRQYLLGTSPPEEAERLEDSFFSDDQTFEEIEIGEEELIDAYVRNQLPLTERKQFEKNLLLLPRVAERIEFARVLDRATQTPSQRPATTDPPNSSKNSIWDSIVAFWSSPQRLGVAAGALVLLIAVSVLFLDWLRLREESRRLAFERAELQRQNEALTSRTDAERRQLTDEVRNQEETNARLQQELKNLEDRPVTLALLRPLTLYPGSSRSPSGGNDLILPSQSAMVRLLLALESDDYPNYDAIVRRGVDGPVAFEGSKLKPSTRQSIKVLELRFPSIRLTAGDYIVDVNGVNPSGDPQFVSTYSFRAVGK